MRTFKLAIVWLVYLAVCTGLLFALTLAPVPALALYFAGYLLVMYVLIPRWFPAPPEPDADGTQNED